MQLAWFLQKTNDNYIRTLDMEQNSYLTDTKIEMKVVLSTWYENDDSYQILYQFDMKNWKSDTKRFVSVRYERFRI